MSLKEYKINEKEILKILTEVAVTRSEAEIVKKDYLKILIDDRLLQKKLFFLFRNWMKKILEKLNELIREKCSLQRD